MASNVILKGLKGKYAYMTYSLRKYLPLYQADILCYINIYSWLTFPHETTVGTFHQYTQLQLVLSIITDCTS